MFKLTIKCEGALAAELMTQAVEAGAKATLEKVKHEAQPVMQMLPQVQPKKVVRSYKQKVSCYDMYREICNFYWREKFKAVDLLDKINSSKDDVEDQISQGSVSAHLHRMKQAGIVIHVDERYYLSQDKMHLSKDKFERIVRNSRAFA